MLLICDDHPHTRLDRAESMIAVCGGHGDEFAGERSLYPYFFSRSEEAGIVNRLKAIH